MTTADLLSRIMKQLHQVRVRCPELRFGQLIATIGMLAEDETGHSLWEVEDVDFASAVERFACDMASRGLERTEPVAAPALGEITSSPTSADFQPPRQVN